MTASTQYTLTATTPLPFAEAVAATRQALADEGFGVLSEIDVQATLKAKLDEDVEPYLILGACSPRDAHQALAAEPELGALLPCNVIVYARDGETHLAAIDPVVMLGIVENPAVEPIAGAIRERLARAVSAGGAATTQVA